MIVGNPSVFAVECSISAAYADRSLLALGMFLIHICNSEYGVRRDDASGLGCSYDEVRRRVANRGLHVAPFAEKGSAQDIAAAFREAVYGNEQATTYFDMPTESFVSLFCTRPCNCCWAPDGDAAFDDGSYVLQFDIEERVRVIAFRCGLPSGSDVEQLCDLWMSADTYYGVLREWLRAFERIVIL